jgi:hypothetical protein
MKNLLTFGLVVWFFLVPFGCAHTPDNPAGMSKQQEIAAVHGQCPLPPVPEELAGMFKQKEITTVQANGMPAVEVSETAFDFGVVKEGNDYIHAFKIKNTGTGVLEIKKILPG